MPQPFSRSYGAGTMPCDGKWRSEDIDLFEHWIADGMAE